MVVVWVNAAGPRGTLRKGEPGSEYEVVREAGCQKGFWGRCRVFWIALGPVGIAVAVAVVVVVLEESDTDPSFVGLADFALPALF